MFTSSSFIMLAP